MENEINNLLDAIKSDYAKFKGRWIAKDEAMKQRQAKMTDDFNTELGFKVGKKYIKITQRNGGSVWGFVVNTDNDSKFKRGDILKAAGYSTPARNQARGNVIEGNLSWVEWTGPAYLN
tara:strand:+ start:23037 stop:23390 length:354 start_codon:yes stop_codon:yes gene_type:complete